ncbi:hypothetical protein AVEN_119848-1 [Araneus ventricosus]|uniref:Uncharacterized protein n=1 Tax=Araneus ventricosus TaxID=182803 RepID=A0A4Y2GNM6_ARAVE|nr:hypothetical protein AVEN_119848-1 [Araneus ventricosus]
MGVKLPLPGPPLVPSLQKVLKFASRDFVILLPFLETANIKRPTFYTLRIPISLNSYTKAPAIRSSAVCGRVVHQSFQVDKVKNKQVRKGPVIESANVRDYHVPYIIRRYVI